MSELKAGDSKQFVIGDKTLTIEPVPYGNIKKILKIVGEVAGAFKSDGDALNQISGQIEKQIPAFLPLLFKKGTVEYMTSDWIDDNLSLTQLREIGEAAIAVNGLKDFFGKRVGAQPPVPPANLTEMPTSTTSSVLPTVGVQTK